MKIKSYIAIVIALAFICPIARASEPISTTTVNLRAFRLFQEVASLSIKVPTVIEAPLPALPLERTGVAVLDKTTNIPQPSLLKENFQVTETPISATTVPYNTGALRMVDKNTQTFTDFALEQNNQGQVIINLRSANPITSSTLVTLLDHNVALPNSVEIQALVGSEYKIVVATKDMTQNSVSFPKTTSAQWMIKFTYGQPLRISELRLIEDNAISTNTKAVRFLAQPGHDYQIYLDPDRQTFPVTGESGNLLSATDVLVVTPTALKKNPGYIISDVDADNVPDVTDNCVIVPNADQQDINHNGRGDKCDDFDQDGITNVTDNCPNNPNQNQQDRDGDGIGDVCDKEESRITEKYTWLPWAGIGFAVVVIFVLLALTARSAKPTESDHSNDQTPPEPPVKPNAANS